jgi:hypothetical protein
MSSSLHSLHYLQSNLNSLEISYMGYTYTFKRNPEDTPEDFHNISWLIAKQKPKNQKEMEKATLLATMWSYQKKYKCSYSNMIQSSLKEIDIFSIDL